MLEQLLTLGTTTYDVFNNIKSKRKAEKLQKQQEEELEKQKKLAQQKRNQSINNMRYNLLGSGENMTVSNNYSLLG